MWRPLSAKETSWQNLEPHAILEQTTLSTATTEVVAQRMSGLRSQGLVVARREREIFLNRCPERKWRGPAWRERAKTRPFLARHISGVLTGLWNFSLSPLPGKMLLRYCLSDGWRYAPSLWNWRGCDAIYRSRVQANICACLEKSLLNGGSQVIAAFTWRQSMLAQLESLAAKPSLSRRQTARNECCAAALTKSNEPNHIFSVILICRKIATAKLLFIRLVTLESVTHCRDNILLTGKSFKS